MDLKKTLLDICSYKKVSGYEQEIAQKLKLKLTQFSEHIEITSTNSVIAKINSTTNSNQSSIILTAHIDEIGFIVSNITEDGFLEIKNCGGINSAIASHQNVEIYGKETLEGFTFMKEDKMYVDVGFKKDYIENIVSLGDRVGFKFNYSTLLNDRISSKSIDNCAGVATILLVLEKLKSVELQRNVVVIFSSQEETSGTGIITSSYSQDADLAICIDVSFAEFLGCSGASYGKMTKGPMIGISPVLDYSLSNKLQNIARQQNIPYQLEIMNGLTSTDADKMTKVKDGIKTCLCSIPIKYMHSPVEMVDLIDINYTADLISYFIKAI